MQKIVTDPIYIKASKVAKSCVTKDHCITGMAFLKLAEKVLEKKTHTFEDVFEVEKYMRPLYDILYVKQSNLRWEQDLTMPSNLEV